MGDRLATIDMGRKLGELGPHLTQCRLGRGLYQRSKWYTDTSSRLATIVMGRKLSGCAPFLGEAQSHLTQCRLGSCAPLGEESRIPI